MSVTAGVSDTVIAVRDKLRGRIGQTKVKRYWPGKAPEWADDNEEDGDIRMSRVASLEKAFPAQESSVSDPARKDDRRLRRLAESKIDNRDEVRADHRRIRKAEIVSATEEEESRGDDAMNVDEDDEDARRRRIRAKALEREKEPALLPVEEEDEEDVEEEEEEEGSEYETDSEEEDDRVMVKPVYVTKQERETIAERERLEVEERALQEMVKRKREERRAETKGIVVEKIREEDEIVRNMESEANVADVDTDDDVNEKEEYDTWSRREIARIKREREDRETALKEKEEIEKVRNMTEEERREWERKNPKPAQPSKRKWSFMQKYYHKGAFFQEDPDDPVGTARSDNIYHRDFSAPTGEDKMDKTILPKVMQVKHFGRSGRTKWTHLVNEDTTDWNTPWTFSDKLRTKYDAKMAGTKPIQRPKGSKKMKDWEKR